MSGRGARIAIGVAVLIAIQVAAVGLYLWVKRDRVGSSEVRFRVEHLREKPATPDITLERPGGDRVQLTALGGRVVLVHFWATWCPPCVEELPGLVAISRELPGLELLAVSTDDDWTVIDRFFDGEIPPEIVRAANHDRASELFDLASLPDTYLAADGRLLLRYGGARDWSANGARHHLRRTLAEIAAGPRTGK